MGFRPKRTRFNIDFTGTNYEGLQISAYSVSFGRLLELEKLASRAREIDSTEGLGEVEKLIQEFIGKVDTWNLDYPDSGEPTPITFEGLLKHEPNVVMDLVLSWYDGIVSVSANDPLEEKSTSGNTFQEASIPMEPLSPNLSS